MTVHTVTAAHPSFPAVADLFDDYRVHFGAPAAPAAARTWLAGGPLTVRAALAPDGSPRGLVTTVVLPASLMMSTFWQIRDLYVSPAHRRAGVARELLAAVLTDARHAGAVRVSLQTEPTNAAALTLYAETGFEPVPGLTVLSHPLT